MIVNLYFYSALLHISFYDTDMKIHEEDWKYFFGEKKEIFNLKKKINRKERKKNTLLIGSISKFVIYLFSLIDFINLNFIQQFISHCKYISETNII